MYYVFSVLSSNVKSIKQTENTQDATKKSYTNIERQTKTHGQ